MKVERQWVAYGLLLTGVGLSSGLKRICNETKALEAYKDDRRPVFKSSPSQFMTIIYSVDYTVTGKDTGKRTSRGTSKGTSKGTSRVQASEQIIRLLRVLTEEMSVRAIMDKLGFKSRDKFILNYLNPALELGVVEMTQPDSPKSPTQRYRLTEAGRKMMEELE